MNRINNIVPVGNKFSGLAKERWDSIAKPLGGLGLLEDFVCKIADIMETVDVDISKRTVVVMCADNGVVDEGVTQTDSSVTAVSSEAIACGRSNINALARAFGADVMAIDIGIERDVECAYLIDRKIAYGTHNIALGAAMSAEEAERAVAVGIDIVKELAEVGTKIIVTGEMGIGNTTTAAALASVLLNTAPETVVGRGAGLSDEGLKRKIAAVKKAIEVNRPDTENPMELLAKLGGFDIAGMTGIFLGGAVYRIPVVIDGVISAVSAALACKLAPHCSDYMLAGHVSSEPSGKMLLSSIGLKAVINAEMHLGEGTGGIMLLPLLDGAVELYRSSHTFCSAGIERYVRIK